MRKYFGTDGIRRIANTELTPELVYKVAKAGAYVLSKHTDHTPTIFIGRDTRIANRGVVVAEAMAAITIVDALFENMHSKMENVVKFYE